MPARPAAAARSTSRPVGAASDDEGAGETHDHDHDHGAVDSGSGDEHGASEETSDHDHSVDTDADDPAVIYCSCVFANCHEAYHAKWGEDEMVAEAACLMEADALPMNGSDVDMGNFIECRMHFCDLAAAGDDTQCAAALGDEICI